MQTAIHRFVEAAQHGENPRVICKVRSGWVVMGEKQVLPGYCLLLPDPVVPHLNALERDKRTEFLDDLCRLGDGLLHLTRAARINYEILGNLEPALHAHAIPRYQDEVEGLRTKPIWFYDWDSAPNWDLEKHADFMSQLRVYLSE